MKTLRLIVLQALALAVLGAPAAAADFVDLRRIEPVSGDAAAGAQKAAALCFACHGADGISPVPMFPNLAGQRADYLYQELLRYKSGSRPDSPMTALVQPLEDADLRNLAVHYAALAANVPAPAEPPAPDLLARGGTLYRQGDPGRGVPPCQGCHGADANGHPLADATARSPYRAYPLLYGQHAAYVATRLRDYRSGALAHTSNDFIMTGVAQRLDDASIDALAAWLGNLPAERQAR
ncbi:MAG TPA: c-type cytochrome [Dokdonella sp.]|uniref:c-type cytochrome n=1 Tax=Dokdonella sp. TaxID=2291710 RepID=UPI002BEF98C5|nr:c-type cytochrome [Dokdonella sp.]HUD42846.1 c-type cytochrome [Dokdonella sp.]